jgi:hypothetical protein
MAEVLVARSGSHACWRREELGCSAGAGQHQSAVQQHCQARGEGGCRRDPVAHGGDEEVGEMDDETVGAPTGGWRPDPLRSW